MKFVARKSQCCPDAGKIIHEFETDDPQKMAEFILGAYSYGDGYSDRRDNDYACIYNCLSDFEKERFDDEDEEYRARVLKSYNSDTPYESLPRDNQLLYILGSFGWELKPIKGPQDIISALVSCHWGDLVIDYEE